MAGKPLLVDTDVFIDYLRGISPACALLDSDEFDIYYSSWTRKELLSKPGLKESERQRVEALLRGFREQAAEGRCSPARGLRAAADRTRAFGQQAPPARPR